MRPIAPAWQPATISLEAKSCCTRTHELCGCAAPPRAHSRDQALAAAAIVISPIVQGCTLDPLARFAGFGKTTAAGPSTKRPLARLRTAKAGLARLDDLAESVPPPMP